MTDLPVERVEQPTSVAAYMPELFRMAVEKGNEGVNALERLVALQERVMDREAAREFADAMAHFQEACPPIKKTSTAKVTTSSGGQYSYAYAELDEIARTVRPIMHKLGLSYSWDCETSENGGTIKVTCTVAHANGHKAHATFAAPTEALTKAMSPQQRHAAALTFARRQSLIQVLGLTTCDPDDDGAVEEDRACISPVQVEILEELSGRCPSGTRDRMLVYFGAKTMEEIRASRFDEAKAGLERKLPK